MGGGLKPTKLSLATSPHRVHDWRVPLTYTRALKRLAIKTTSI